MEFWPEVATEASWTRLQQMQREFPFTLIGGWAVFLWTHQHKSKDIDIVVNQDTLHQLKKTQNLQKNDRLREYEVKYDLFDVDIYVEHYSKLTLPVQIIAAHAQNVEGFSVASAETLLILKLGAHRDRHASIKGRKDAIDILTLLIHAPIDWKAYRLLLKENRLETLADNLKRLVQNFDPDDLRYVGQNVHSYKKWKNEFLKEFQENTK